MARAAVERLPAVSSVSTDMNQHTVTVAFDDEELTVAQIIAALSDAGYAVRGDPKVP